MSIRHEYIKTLGLLEDTSPIRFYDNVQLTDLAMHSRIKKKFNATTSWDLFKPNIRKPYSILNNHDSTKSGEHWVSVYQTRTKIYVYDSFARTKRLMKPFVEKMSKMGYKVEFVNKNKDQSEYQINCGLRALLFLIFVNKYGIAKARKI